METKTGPCLCGGPEKVKLDIQGNQYIERCPLYIKIRGTHPQTGKEVDQWFCSLAAMPILLIETSQQVRQGAAATESLRNEIVQRADQARLERLAVPLLPIQEEEPCV